MIQKLTADQAAWLIEQFEIQAEEEDLSCDLFMRDSVTKIINQCTEKVFPEITMHVGDQGSLEVTASMKRENHASIGMSFKNVKGCVACIDLNAHELEMFAQGCSKIVTFLEAE